MFSKSQKWWDRKSTPLPIFVLPSIPFRIQRMTHHYPLLFHFYYKFFFLITRWSSFSFTLPLPLPSLKLLLLNCIVSKFGNVHTDPECLLSRSSLSVLVQLDLDRGSDGEGQLAKGLTLRHQVNQRCFSDARITQNQDSDSIEAGHWLRYHEKFKINS